MSRMIPYAPAPGKRRLYSLVLRTIVLAIGLCCLALCAVVVLAPDRLPWKPDDTPGLYGSAAAPVNFSDKPVWYAFLEDGPGAGYYAWGVLWIGLMLVGQWVFLLPKGGWRLAVRPEAVRPMRRAAGVAGIIATLLSVGAVAVLLDVGNLWERITITQPADKGVQDFRAVWIAMLVLWAGWAFVFWRYFKTASDGYRGLSVVYRYLLAGTVLELLVAGPAHAINASKDDCYCVKGSYTALVFGATCALWLFGPGLYLLFLREKHRTASDHP